MLHRKLYTIVFLSTLLIAKLGFFSANAEETADFCDSSVDRNFEHIVACYHLKINDITNKQIANLKLFHKVIDPNRPVDSELPTLTSVQQKMLLDPVTHYNSQAEDTIKQAALEECTSQTNTITNVNPQCLISLSLNQFEQSETEILEFIKMPVNQAQKLSYQTYWREHKLVILDMLEANVMIYNQMFMSYPIHTNILKMQEQAETLIQELDKTVDIIKKIPNKFENASTTECT